MMFLKKMRCFFNIFPVISTSKPMKMAKTEFRGTGAAAITSGLAAAGGSMLGGIALVAAAPIAVAAAGGAIAYGIARAVQDSMDE